MSGARDKLDVVNDKLRARARNVKDSGQDATHVPLSLQEGLDLSEAIALCLDVIAKYAADVSHTHSIRINNKDRKTGPPDDQASG